MKDKKFLKELDYAVEDTINLKKNSDAYTYLGAFL